MDIVMDHSPPTVTDWPRDPAATGTATTSDVSHDLNDTDVLQDSFFRHSQEIDAAELDDLLDTKFENSDDTSSRRPSFDFGSGAQSDHRSAVASVEPSKAGDTSSLFLQNPSHPPTASHTLAMSGFPVNAPESDQAPTNMRFYASDTFGHHDSTQQPQSFHSTPLQQQPSFANNGHWYPNFNTGAMASSPAYPYSGLGIAATAPSSHDSLWQYPSPMHPPSRPGTADLMDYDNAVPEEDEFGDDLDGAEPADPCYAQLLYRCLMEAPDHTMTLKDLYGWVSDHSQKAKDAASKGWQNSVRHNLSMNAAFERVQASNHHGSVKKGSLWRLTAQALQEGVISTTRYRKNPKRKPERKTSPALKRQISGAKGGQATRAASQHRRAVQARLNGLQRHARQQRDRVQVQYYGSPTSAGSSRPSASPSPAFYHPQPQPGSYLAMNGLPQPTSAPSSHPSSPYFMPPQDNEPFALVGGQAGLNADPHTPPQVQIGLDNNDGRKTSGLLTEFDLAHLGYGDRSLFGNVDDGMVVMEGAEVETPSMTTEASFFSDERGSVEPVFC